MKTIFTTILLLAICVTANAQSKKKEANIFGGSVGISPLLDKGVGVSLGASYDRYLLKWLAVGATLQYDYQNQFPAYANKIAGQQTDQRVVDLIHNDPTFNGWKSANILSLYANVKFAPLNTRRSLLTLGGGLGVRFANTLQFDVQRHGSFANGYKESYGHGKWTEGIYTAILAYDYKFDRGWMLGLNLKMFGSLGQWGKMGFSSTYFTPAIAVSRRF